MGMRTCSKSQNIIFKHARICKLSHRDILSRLGKMRYVELMKILLCSCCWSYRSIKWYWFSFLRQPPHKRAENEIKNKIMFVFSIYFSLCFYRMKIYRLFVDRSSAREYTDWTFCGAETWDICGEEMMRVEEKEKNFADLTETEPTARLSELNNFFPYSCLGYSGE